jgi:predicted RNA-binding protein associated with RNAse of E/G family
MSANSAEAGQAPTVDVVLVKAGRTKIRYPAELLADDGTRIAVRAPWAGTEARDFGFVRFEAGDVFTEFYWRDRWYAVKEVRAADGTLKGWYCDITRPAERAGARLVVEDLDLDLWRSADGGDVRRLDEDEFAASGLAERDPEAASAAVAALDELERLARDGGFEALFD